MDIEGLSFQSNIKNELNRLDFQRSRILSYNAWMDPSIPNVNHDADFYMVLLRRLFRNIEKTSRYDSRIANLKGRFERLYKKIKIRDHFEHDIDIKDIPEYSKNIKIMCSVVLNNTNPHIVSGDQIWTLNEDHDSFKTLVEQYIKLFPFRKPTEKKRSIIQRILTKFCRRINC